MDQKMNASLSLSVYRTQTPSFVHPLTQHLRLPKLYHGVSSLESNFVEGYLD